MAPAEASSFSSLERMVVKPTWKEILLDLIAQNKIDPWDVDIVKLADEFMLRVKEMRRLDLALHANVILAASILLKYKSDYLRYFAMPPAVEDAALEVVEPLPELDTELALVARIPPKRQITMVELMAEMERVIKYESSEIKRTPKGSITETLDLLLVTEDIEKIKEEMLARIRNNVDETGFTTFSSILKEKTRLEIVYSLLSLLHLAKEGAISLYQEKLFGEILIGLTDNSSEKEDNDKNKNEKKEEAKIEAKS